MGMISSHIQSTNTDTDFEDLESPSTKQIGEDGKDRWPAEIFRTDFITAMKIADNQILPEGEHYELVDTWRQEWEKGVQVPVNTQVFPTIGFRKKDVYRKGKRCNTFSLPMDRISLNSPELHDQVEKPARCIYDLDDLDVSWLEEIKAVSYRGRSNFDECLMEKSMTLFEKKCFDNMVHAVATRKGLSIEYDDSTICDVCLSPDTEDNNEIVFCDACNMCVHQACYGISDIPSGTWLCRPCSRGVLSPQCVICPNKGGAMKRVKNSFEWIHVICAWWVPEVKIEDTEAVEQVTIDKIPTSRKNLCCSLCRQKVGACIQCSVKRCVAAYHVTCAVKGGLEMQTLMLQEKDDVQHISFCKRHGIEKASENSTKTASTMLENQRLYELQMLQEEFFKLVDLRTSARELRISRNLAAKLFNYWILKRKASENKPLVPLTAEQQEKLNGKQGLFLIQQQVHIEMERYSHLRQDLERLRNLCYLIIRRERTKREIHRVSQEIFNKQDIILDAEKSVISQHDYNMLASGSKLMRFTRFPHYCTDGPPYVDHLHEDEIQEYAHKDIDVEQTGSDPSFLNSSIGDLLTCSRVATFDGFGNESGMRVNAKNITLTGKVNSAIADKCREESNQSFTLTCNMLPEAIISTANCSTNAKVEQHHFNILADYTQSCSQSKQVPSEFCKGIHNAALEASHVPMNIDVRRDANVEHAMVANGEMQSIAILGERPGSFKQSKSDANQFNSLPNYAPPLESITQNAFSNPETVFGCSSECDYSCIPSITSETNDDNSVAEIITCTSLGIKPSFKHGRKRRLPEDITSKRILRRNTSFKQTSFEDCEAHAVTSLHNLMSNRVRPANTNVHLDRLRQLDNQPPTADECSIIPTSKSSTNESLQMNNNFSSFTVGEAFTHLPSLVERESEGTYIREPVFLHKEVSKPSDLFTSDTDPCSVTVVSASGCSTLNISTSSGEPVCYADASQAMLHFNERCDMLREIISPVCSLDSISCSLSGSESFTIVTENGERCANFMEGCEKTHPRVDVKDKARHGKVLSGILPIVDGYYSNKFMEKTNSTQIQTNQEEGALTAGSDKPSQTLNIKRNADIVDHDSSRCNVMPEQSLPQGMCKSTKDIELYNESPTSCSKSIPENTLGFLNACNIHVSAYDGNRQGPEDLAIRCNDSIIPKVSSINFDSLNAKTQTDRRALSSGDAVKSPFVLLNEVTNLKGTKCYCDLGVQHDSPPGYRRLGNTVIPAFPRSVIDDLTACPQRLTRGHTQLMMMQPYEQFSSSKGETTMPEAMFEATAKTDISTALPESGSHFENLQLQDTGREKIHPLGYAISAPADFELDHVSKKRCSIPSELKALAKSAILKTEQEETGDQLCNDQNIAKLVINPTRLTRARTKSLGFQQYSSDDLVSV